MDSRLERAARALLDAASRIEAETMCVVPRRLVDALRSALAAQPAQAGAYHVVAWAEVHESTGGRHHAAMLMRGEDIIGDFFDPNQAQAACDALNAAEQPAQAGEAVAWRNVEAALREWEGRVVIRAKMEEAKEGGIAYAREQESRALMVALGAIHAYAAHPTPRAEAASAVPAWRDSFPPTHYCRECRALWRRWPDGSWSLVTMSCGKCCDNVLMGEQIAPLASEYPTLLVERPTALATPGEVAPGAPNQAGVTAGETAPTPATRGGQVMEALRLILPLAKGYAAEHPVGSNAAYVRDAEAALYAYEGRL